MPYKDPEAQRRAQHEHYLRNKALFLERQRERRKVPGSRDRERDRLRVSRIRPCFLCGRPEVASPRWPNHPFGLCDQYRCISIYAWWSSTTRHARRVPRERTDHAGVFILAEYLIYAVERRKDAARAALRAKHSGS